MSKHGPDSKRTEIVIAGEHVATIIDHGRKNVSWTTHKYSATIEDAFDTVSDRKLRPMPEVPS